MYANTNAKMNCYVYDKPSNIKDGYSRYDFAKSRYNKFIQDEWSPHTNGPKSGWERHDRMGYELCMITKLKFHFDCMIYRKVQLVGLLDEYNEIDEPTRKLREKKAIMKSMGSFERELMGAFIPVDINQELYDEIAEQSKNAFFGYIIKQKLETLHREKKCLDCLRSTMHKDKKHEIMESVRRDMCATFRVPYDMMMKKDPETDSMVVNC